MPAIWMVVPLFGRGGVTATIFNPLKVLLVKIKKQQFGFAAISAGVLLATTALAGTPVPSRDTPAAIDQGLVRDLAGAEKITVTIPLKLHDPVGAESFLRHVSTPGDSQYRKFVSSSEFAKRFGPTDADIAKVRESLAKFGLTVERKTTTTLHVTGTPAQLEQALKVTLHQYSVPTRGEAVGYSFREPTERATIPAEIEGLVHGVIGLSDRPRFHTNVTHALTKMGNTPIAVSGKVSTTGLYPAFGEWTARTFAKYYGADPLYTKGVTGKGETMAIVTLASFTPADAYRYWKDIGLTVSESRIKVVNVDGGPGAPSDQAGSDETTLDVEQSGGVAPGAKIVVYQAPNTTQGFIDAFAQAADDNIAESISCSWGEWEWFDNLENSPATDPVTGTKDVSDLTATHDVFVKSGSQGQSMFTAAGDAGAYDVNREYGTDQASLTLSVDYPASDPAITAAGGTTLPGKQTYEYGPNNTLYHVNLPVENAWSWKYLNDLCVALKDPVVDCGIFPVGGGGGVSVFWPRPSYQTGLSKFRDSEPDQEFIYYGSIPTELVFKLPGHYAGRNVPDISSNADPDTGYSLYYTSSASGKFGVKTFYGGTSFVAPQFNGVAALLEQNAGGRVGFLNPFLYKLAAESGTYDGKAPSLHYILAGDNDYWASRKGYTVATGLGTLEITHLAHEYNLTK